MDGNNAFLAEMFAEGVILGTRFSNVFRFNNKKIDISKLDLSEDDWSIVEMYLARGSCIDLVFIIMIYHFPEKFDDENIQTFKDLGNSQVRKFSQEMQKCQGKNEYLEIFQKVKKELKGVPTYA